MQACRYFVIVALNGKSWCPNVECTNTCIKEDCKEAVMISTDTPQNVGTYVDQSSVTIQCVIASMQVNSHKLSAISSTIELALSDHRGFQQEMAVNGK